MSQNAPTIPLGEFPLLINTTTKAWRSFRCVGSIILDGPEHDSLRILPPTRGRSSEGYPAEVEVSLDVDLSRLITIAQLTGDKRRIMIRKRTRSEGRPHWSVTLPPVMSNNPGPFKLVIYAAEFEALLEYLISLK